MANVTSQAYSYLQETETASRQLFTALEYYNQLLKNIKPPFLIRDVAPTDDREAIFAQWYKQNEDEIRAARERKQQ